MLSAPSALEPGSKKKVMFFIVAIIVVCGGVAVYIGNFYNRTVKIQDNAADEIANYSTDISAIKPANAANKTKLKKSIPFEEIFQNNNY